MYPYGSIASLKNTPFILSPGVMQTHFSELHTHKFTYAGQRVNVLCSKMHLRSKFGYCHSRRTHAQARIYHTYTHVYILNQAWESHCWHLQDRRLPALCTGASACIHIDAARARGRNTHTEIKSNSTSACLPLIHESDVTGVCQYACLREMFIYRKLFIRY